MIIHIEICDHCESPPRGLPMLAYSIVGESGERHICQACQRRPFRRVEPSKRGRAIAEVVRLALEAP